MGEGNKRLFKAMPSTFRVRIFKTVLKGSQPEVDIMESGNDGQGGGGPYQEPAEGICVNESGL